MIGFYIFAILTVIELIIWYIYYRKFIKHINTAENVGKIIGYDLSNFTKNIFRLIKNYESMIYILIFLILLSNIILATIMKLLIEIILKFI